MGTVTINGNTYSGNNIVVRNGKVSVDGVDFTPETKEINISVVGDIKDIKVDVCEAISVSGNVTSISTKSGDIVVEGDVLGGIQTMSGDVDCNDVKGSISTMSGDIKHRTNK